MPMPDSGPEAAQRLVEQAREARRAGRARDAVKLLRKAMAADPHGVHPRNTLAIVLFDAYGAVEEAEALLTGACRDNPGSAVAHLNLGNILLAAQKPTEAITVHRGFLERVPGDFGNRLGLANAFARAGRFSDATAHYARLAAERPQEQALAYRVAVTAEAAGDRAQACGSYSRAIDLAPQSRYGLIARLRLEEAPTHPARTCVPRIGFYLGHGFHLPIFRRSFDLLSQRFDCFLSPDPDEVFDRRPAVLVVADAVAHTMRPHLPGSTIVHTRHGLISKNHVAFGARISDYICVTSELQMNDVIAGGGVPRRGFWITGSLQMDGLFRGERQPLPFPLAPGRPVILYAPTYNPHLSSAPMLGPGIVAAMRGDQAEATIVIKPHPLTRKSQPQWLAWWQAAASSHPDVHLISDPSADLMTLMPWADVLVSDVSSAIFAYLALDRPIILLTNPDHMRDGPHFDPQGIEWRWRDLGETLGEASQLAPAIARALADPARFAQRRATYRRRLFGDLTDGRAAERLSARITALLCPETP